jgi:hypothetical protein
MTKFYYFQQFGTKNIFYTDDVSYVPPEDEYIFLGSSKNPNKQMAVAAFKLGQNDEQQTGYNIQSFGKSLG